MKNLDDILQFENENTSLDFKGAQYHKSNYESLLKDIMSMANANIQGDRLIISGVKYYPNGVREIIGINEDFIDDASYQQLVRENIEPDIDFKYFAYEFQDMRVGVFQITNCSNPPYMLRKDFGKLKKGDAYIRKGSHQTRMTRKDFDLFIEQKITSNSFDGKLLLFFSETNSKVIEIQCAKTFELPSDKAASKIKKILKDREIYPRLGLGQMPFIPNLSVFGSTPYENRSTEALKRNLETVKEAYQDDDFYYVFEVVSSKINFMIANQGCKYVEDASIEVRIDKKIKFLIATKIYSKPQSVGIENVLYPMPYMPIIENINYPKVTETENEYIIFDKIGDIKHNIPQEAFGAAIRLFIGKICIGHQIILNCKIFGKNVVSPIEDKLEIKVIE